MLSDTCSATCVWQSTLNPRITEAGKSFWDHQPVTDPHLDNPTRTLSVTSKGWQCHHFPGQPLPVLPTLSME